MCPDPPRASTGLRSSTTYPTKNTQFHGGSCSRRLAQRTQRSTELLLEVAVQMDGWRTCGPLIGVAGLPTRSRDSRQDNGPTENNGAECVNRL